MKVVCAPENHEASESGDLHVVLYGQSTAQFGSVGAAVKRVVQKRQLEVNPRAWDMLSIALAVVAADTGVRRNESPDGWTRQLDLEVAVREPDFWNSQRTLLNKQLRFLTTDIWNISFHEDGAPPPLPDSPTRPPNDAVMLLSGGLDSLIGGIDLVAKGELPFLVSQVAQGDAPVQRTFASRIGESTHHLQLNHNANCPGSNERSQRSRSIIFLAYGVLAATALQRYHEGDEVTLYVCENGFISINPPLTGSRLGSLSTRTTHPLFLELFQNLLVEAGLRVRIHNPYQFVTKGEMLLACSNQQELRKYAHVSTSCGRYARSGYKHCGRCLPCLIRRASMHRWGNKDFTEYVYEDLSQDDKNHARHDDVRAAAMAVEAAKIEGISRWAGPALSSMLLGGDSRYADTVARGLGELEAFLVEAGVID